MTLARKVPVASLEKDYAVRLVRATPPRTDAAAPIASQYLRFGSSPRGGQTLLLAGKVRAPAPGRVNVRLHHPPTGVPPAPRPPLVPKFASAAAGVTTHHIIHQVLKDPSPDAASL